MASNDRGGRYAGGSPVDTARANSSPEELERQDASARENRGPAAGDENPDRPRSGADAPAADRD
jgi:hypothetical protein